MREGGQCAWGPSAPPRPGAVGRGRQHGAGPEPGEAGGGDPLPRGQPDPVLSGPVPMQGHLQGQRGDDHGQHGQRGFPGRAGALHRQGDFRGVAGQANHFHADRQPVPRAVRELQPEHPAPGPGAYDHGRAHHHARRQMYFTAPGAAALFLPQVRLEAAPQLPLYGGGGQEKCL